MVFSSIFIFFKFAPNENKKYTIFSKESFIIANNWFMIFFLAVVLIGTLYPVFLDTIMGSKISVGPPYYNLVLAPILIPLLFLMTSGPNYKWVSNEAKSFFNIVLLLSIVFFIITFFIIEENSFLLNLILFFSIYLITQTLFDFYESSKKRNINVSRIISHLGFGLLIFFIYINHIFSIENNFNLKLGETKKTDHYIIKFINLEQQSVKNYKSIVGYFNILDKKTSKSEELNPEIRIYDKPITITYEASIKSSLFSDTYLTMSNISVTDIFNIKFQVKPFMNFIWFSVLLLSLGGILNFFNRKNYEKN